MAKAVRSSTLLLAAFILQPSAPGLAAPAAAQAGPAAAERRAATEADYRQTLARLGLTSLRPGADGRNPDAPNAANYAEERAGRAGPLPPLLVSSRGQAVRTARQWWSVRRPELTRLLEREVYGRVPATAPQIRWELQSVANATRKGVPVTRRRYVGRATGADASVAIDLAVTLPRAARGPVPVILELGFPEGFRFPGAPPPPADEVHWTDRALARGWGYAILDPRSVQPDDGAGLREGVIGIASRGRPRQADEWGALRAWAWGASRAYDLLAQDRAVDPSKIAIAGLSRYGKAALVAMAFDRRFANGLIGSSGAGGAKLLRRDFGERLENLASSGEYHWFAPNFLRYAGPRTVRDLPVDAHSLIALVAPRPIFIGAGTLEEGDGWVDPKGSYEAAKAASPVYRLLGVPGLVGPPEFSVGQNYADGRLAFRQHERGHTNGPNWPFFFDFAARHWSAGRR
jgi:hypothetical protein